MGPFQIPILNTVFKVIEARIPGGFVLTTAASLLLVLAIIELLREIKKSQHAGENPQPPTSGR